MGNRTVKKRIFLSNALMVIVTLVIFLMINLTDHIMEPLDALAEGAKRIKENDLTQDIVYTGELEFENVCAAFNDMQEFILAEQEKNRKYEKARTDMIVGISHDLRTPLTAMKGTIKGLMDGVASTPEQQKKFLNAAYRRTGDMDMLLNQLLYLSRMETGNMPISMQTIEIADFLKKYVKGKPEEIRIRDLRILVNSWKVYKGDKEIKFPNREFEILKFFAMNPNIVFSKEHIFEKIWGAGYRLNK